MWQAVRVVLVVIMMGIGVMGAEEVKSSGDIMGINGEDIAKEVGKEEVPALNGQQLLLKLVVYLVVMASACWGIFYVLRKWNMGGNVLMRKGGKLRIVETLAVGNRQYLAVVEYEGEKVMVSMSTTEIKKICKLKGNGHSEG